MSYKHFLSAVMLLSGATQPLSAWQTFYCGISNSSEKTIQVNVRLTGNYGIAWPVTSTSGFSTVAAFQWIHDINDADKTYTLQSGQRAVVGFYATSNADAWAKAISALVNSAINAIGDAALSYAGGGFFAADPMGEDDTIQPKVRKVPGFSSADEIANEFAANANYDHPNSTNAGSGDEVSGGCLIVYDDGDKLGAAFSNFTSDAVVYASDELHKGSNVTYSTNESSECENFLKNVYPDVNSKTSPDYTDAMNLAKKGKDGTWWGCMIVDVPSSNSNNHSGYIPIP